MLNPLPVPCALKLSETAVNCLNVSLFVSWSLIKAKPSFKFLRRILEEWFPLALDTISNAASFPSIVTPLCVPSLPAYPYKYNNGVPVIDAALKYAPPETTIPLLFVCNFLVPW